MSKYMDKKFQEFFSEVAEFWTGEDGMLMSIVVTRTADAAKLLSQHRAFNNEPFEVERMKPKYAYRTWLHEWAMNSCTVKGWMTCETATPYPVFEYELQIPR